MSKLWLNHPFQICADIRQTLLLKIAIIVSSYLQSKKKKY